MNLDSAAQISPFPHWQPGIKKIVAAIVFSQYFQQFAARFDNCADRNLFNGNFSEKWVSGTCHAREKRIKRAGGKRNEEERNENAIFMFPGCYYPNSIRVKIPCFEEGKITLFRIGSYLNLMNGAM